MIALFGGRGILRGRSWWEIGLMVLSIVSWTILIGAYGYQMFTDWGALPGHGDPGLMRFKGTSP